MADNLPNQSGGRGTNANNSQIAQNHGQGYHQLSVTSTCKFLIDIYSRPFLNN